MDSKAIKFIKDYFASLPFVAKTPIVDNQGFEAGSSYYCKINGMTYHCYTGLDGLRFTYQHKDIIRDTDTKGMDIKDFTKL